MEGRRRDLQEGSPEGSGSVWEESEWLAGVLRADLKGHRGDGALSEVVLGDYCGRKSE